MKKILAFLMFIGVCSSFAADKESYKIQVKVKGALKDSACHLAHYYGQKQYLIQDTAKPTADGTFTFEGKKTLPGGIYLVVLHNKKFFELLIDKEQNFSVETDTSDFVKHMKIKGSKDNQAFYDYHNFVARKYKEVEPLREKLKKVKSNKDSTEMLQKQIKQIDEDVKNYKLDFIKKNPTSFLTKVFKAMQEPEVPETPKLANGRPDSTFPYRYYKAHYWDGIDFSDDKILRTPIFQGKLKQYMEQLTVQHPDSIINSVDYMVEKARANKDVFKYVVSNLIYDYETSKIMGFDAIFVHIAKRYFATRQATWIDSTQNAKIVNRALLLDPLLLGKPAPSMNLYDTIGAIHSLYDIKSRYTIVYFWDPTCGHCKKATPKLHELLVSKLKAKGVTVFSIANENYFEEWKKFLKENKLTEFINVSDLQHKYDFKQSFDIYSYPVIYLLDENKKILAKRLDVEQLEEFIDRLDKDKEKAKK